MYQPSLNQQQVQQEPPKQTAFQTLQFAAPMAPALSGLATATLPTPPPSFVYLLTAQHTAQHSAQQFIQGGLQNPLQLPIQCYLQPLPQ